MTKTKKKISDAVKKYKSFHGKNTAKVTSETIEVPNELIFIGDAFEIAYKSDKLDGKARHYVHKLKKHGKILISPKGDMIIITGLNLKIKSVGLTG